MKLQTLIEKIEIANDSYRKGKAIISDAEYDALVDELKELDPHHPILSRIGYSPENSDPRKEKLPIFMGSLNKVKTLNEIKSWLEGKAISSSTMLIATPKYDGLSILKDEKYNKVWTRGDGEVGLNITEHFTFVKEGNFASTSRIDYSYGEAIISKKVFKEKYALEYANPRNMVASLFNTKVPDPNKLKDVTYIRYGAIRRGDLFHKLTQLSILNKFLNWPYIPYKIGTVDFFTKEVLDKFYLQWSEDFEIDGIVLDVDDSGLIETLGREFNGNPAYARAYKGDFEEIKATYVNNIRWQISKHGALKPVLEVEAVNLEGAEVTNVTAYNASFLIEKGIEVGSAITIKRSGKVIPKVVEVLNPSESVPLPYSCPCCGSILQWDHNRVDLYCSNDNCPDRIINQNLSFFEQLGVEIGEPTIRKLYKAGFISIPSICKMGWTQWEKLEGFGFVSATNMVDDIGIAINKATLKELMAASPYFPGLGVKTLNLIKFAIDINYLEDDDVYYNQQFQKLQNIEGIGFVSANTYLYGLPKFYAFLRELPIVFRVWDGQEEKGDLFRNKVFVFTGFRDKELEKVIEKAGGKVTTSVSPSTSLVITDDLNSTTSKMVKARELNIPILTLSNFKEHYKI